MIKKPNKPTKINYIENLEDDEDNEDNEDTEDNEDIEDNDIIEDNEIEIKKSPNKLKIKNTELKKDFIELKIGNAELIIPQDKIIIDKIIKMLKAYREDLEEEDYKLPDLKPKLEISEDYNKKVESSKDVEVYKSFEIPKIMPKEEIPFNINSKTCPMCNSKLKRKKIKKEGNLYKQIIKCKKWSCPFEKEIILKV